MQAESDRLQATLLQVFDASCNWQNEIPYLWVWGEEKEYIR
jgi:hypothetical protein